MQKQLITDQLIEEYQKEIKSWDNRLNSELTEYMLSMYRNFIRDIQSKRQQEVQNVIDGYDAGWFNRNDDSSYITATDYFTQTFEQKGGGQK